MNMEEEDIGPYSGGYGSGCDIHGEDYLRECTMCGVEFCAACFPRSTLCADCAAQADLEDQEEEAPPTEEEKELLLLEGFNDDEPAAEDDAQPEPKPPAAPKTAAKGKAPPAAKAAPPAQAAKPAKPAKPPKVKKPKLVRDRFTATEDDMAVLRALKQRAGKLDMPVKKGTVLRAGVRALTALSDTALVALLKQVPALK